MDAEIEDWSLPNNTDEWNNFAFDLTAWDIVRNSTAIAFATLSLISDILIIYMIARNSHLRSKTNLLLMNFAISDAGSLIFNIYILSYSVILNLFGIRHNAVLNHLNCVLNHVEIGFQANENIFLLLIISNTLIKSKRIQIKWIVIFLHTLVVLNFIINVFTCQLRNYPMLVALAELPMLLNFTVVLCKEFNNCYKKWYKKDPLSSGTLFRLHLGRIYTVCWLSSFFISLMEGSVSDIIYIFALNIYLTGFCMLLYIVYADKNFKICFRDLVRCKGAGDVDVDHRNNNGTSAEELSEAHQVNINVNAV